MDILDVFYAMDRLGRVRRLLWLEHKMIINIEVLCLEYYRNCIRKLIRGINIRLKYRFPMFNSITKILLICLIRIIKVKWIFNRMLKDMLSLKDLLKSKLIMKSKHYKCFFKAKITGQLRNINLIKLHQEVIVFLLFICK